MQNIDNKYQNISQKEEEAGLLQAYHDEECHGNPHQIPSCHMPMHSRRMPLWRRMARGAMVIVAVLLLVMTIVPMIWSRCKHAMDSMPYHDRFPSNRKLHGGDEPGGEKPKLHYEFSKDIKTFWMKQQSSHIPTRAVVYGKVLMHAPKNVDHITVDFDIHVSDTSLWEKIRIEPKEDGIVISPQAITMARQFINVTAYVAIPNRYHDLISIDTNQLNIELDESITLPVKEAYLETVSGNINCREQDDKPMQSEYLYIKTQTGHVKGAYSLSKNMDIETTSGYIDIGVNSKNLKEVDAKLATKTVTGKQVVDFVSHLHPRPLKSYHESLSGSVHLRYPSDWQGNMKLETMTGDIDVWGKGVEVVKKQNGSNGKYWKMIKGSSDMSSFGKVKTGTGKINVGVGHEKN